MTNETSGIKYSKQLAINETSSKKQIEQLKLFDDEQPDFLTSELKKSLYTFNIAHDIIFDGLSLACTTLYDKEWQDATGEWHDIIGRKTDITETHYRLFAPEELLKAIFAGPFEDDWPEIRKKLIKLSSKPERKKLIIDKTHYIIDAPIKVTPWYETESVDKFTNLSPRRKGKSKEERQKSKRETGKARGRIIGFSIEFFKPLFEPILEINTKKKRGAKYLITPPYFQLKLNTMHREILSRIDYASTSTINELITKVNTAQNNGVIKKSDKKNLITKYKLKSDIESRKMKKKVDRVTPQDVRKFYLALALKDNHTGSYITIDNLIEFVDGIWPELIRSDRNGNKVLQPAEYTELIDKINVILKVYLSVLAIQGDMDGAQLVPLEIMNHNTGLSNQLQIKCIKKKSLYSKYTKDEIEKSISLQITSVL